MMQLKEDILSKFWQPLDWILIDQTLGFENIQAHLNQWKEDFFFFFLSLFNSSYINHREQKLLSILNKVNWLPWFSCLTCITSTKHIINLNSWGLERLQSCTLQINILNLANLFNPWVQKGNIDNEAAPILMIKIENRVYQPSASLRWSNLQRRYLDLLRGSGYKHRWSVWEGSKYKGFRPPENDGSH